MKLTHLAGLSVIALALVVAPKVEDAALPPVPGPENHIAPETVVEWMIGGRQHYHLIDVRSISAFLENGLRGSIAVPADSLDRILAESLPPEHLLIVYGEREIDAVESYRKIRAVREDVLILEGGYAAWNERILQPTEPAPDAPEASWTTYRERIAVANFLLGKTDSAPLPERRAVTPIIRPRSQIKNEGC